MSKEHSNSSLGCMEVIFSRNTLSILNFFKDVTEFRATYREKGICRKKTHFNFYNSFHSISFYFISFHFVFCFILFYFILFYFILSLFFSYFILHYVSFCFMIWVCSFSYFNYQLLYLLTRWSKGRVTISPLVFIKETTPSRGPLFPAGISKGVCSWIAPASWDQKTNATFPPEIYTNKAFTRTKRFLKKIYHEDGTRQWPFAPHTQRSEQFSPVFFPARVEHPTMRKNARNFNDPRLHIPSPPPQLLHRKRQRTFSFLPRSYVRSVTRFVRCEKSASIRRLYAFICGFWTVTRIISFTSASSIFGGGIRSDCINSAAFGLFLYENQKRGVTNVHSVCINPSHTPCFCSGRPFYSIQNKIN